MMPPTTVRSIPITAPTTVSFSVTQASNVSSAFVTPITLLSSSCVTPGINVPFHMTPTLHLPPAVTQAMTSDRHVSNYHKTSAVITPTNSDSCPIIEQITADFIIPENKLYQLRAQAVANTPTHFCVILITRVADSGFVCTFMSTPKLFRNQVIGGH